MGDKVGQVLTLIFRDPVWDKVSIGQFKRIFAKCHELKQFELLRAGHTDGEPDMFVMWAWLSKNAEERYVNGGFNALTPDDIQSAGQLWLIATVAPKAPEHLAGALSWASGALPKNKVEKSFRCLAPIHRTGDLEPVEFRKMGANKGKIEPVYLG